MKKIKILVLTIIISILTTGCFKRDNMDDIEIYTTTYPLSYLVDKIYGYNSTVKSIYPTGINPSEYKLTTKQIKDYSQTDMFIYNGLNQEKATAAQFLNNNDDIKIIDVTKGLSITRDEEELWLCPSNYLMLAQNIKNSLIEYTNSTIVSTEIDDNYNDLKLTISKYDAELKLIADNATKKTIIVGNDVFKFLEKYGFIVLSVEDNDFFSSNEFQEAKNSLAAGKNKSIFILDTDDENLENTQKIVANGATIVKINSMKTINDEQPTTDDKYTLYMNDFIEKLKMEAYN